MAARKRSESLSDAADTAKISKNGVLRPGAKVWVGPTESTGVVSAAGRLSISVVLFAVPLLSTR